MSHQKINILLEIKGNTKGVKRIIVINRVLSINLVVMIFTKNPAKQKKIVLSNLPSTLYRATDILRLRRKFFYF